VEEVLAVPPAFPMYAYSIASPEQLQARIDTRTQFTGKQISFWCVYSSYSIDTGIFLRTCPV